MIHTYWKRAGSVLFALALAVAGCSGDKGDTGPAGPTGATGGSGSDGVSTGSIAGKFLISTPTGAPVVGATVTTVPVGVTATTASDGTFTLTGVPIGTYSIKVSGTGVTQTQFDGIVVVAATTTDIGTKKVAYSPIAITFGSVPNPAGFAQDVAITANVTGTTGTPTYAWTKVSGPAGSFSATNTANTTYTTGTFAAVHAALKYHRVPDRAGLINYTAQQVTDASEVLRLSVNDGTYTQQKDLTIATVGWDTGATNVGVGTMVVGNGSAGQTSYAWTLTKNGADASSLLKDAATRNPWFFPDGVGTYVLANAVDSITLSADTFVGATETCGGCHSSTVAAKVAGIWDEYKTSAHANFNWQDPSQPAMGLFAAGIDGYASSHYGASCVQCHTTGYNPQATNGGFDELGFVFPSVLQSGNFAALTADQKRLGVIGCESCHGPIANHAALTKVPGASADPPKAFFNAEACGYCHDSMTHHDKYNLWSQGGHSSLTTAQGENRSTCTRCHTAQGYRAWTDLNLDDTAYKALDTTGKGNVTFPASTVEPQTCQACHDPHTTRLRVDTTQSVVLPAGYTVAGGGAGELCMTCHNTRNGAHGDTIAVTNFTAPHQAAQTDVFMGQNAYFMSGLNISRHAAVAETCVGCHMAKVGADADHVPANTNHTFKVTTGVCANCHGTDVNGEALKAAVEGELPVLNQKASAYVMAKLNAAPFSAVFVDLASGASSSTYDATSSKYVTVAVPVDTSTNLVTAVTMVEGHGQMAAEVTFTTPVTIQIPSAANDGTLVDVTASQFEFQLGNAFTGGTDKKSPLVFAVTPTWDDPTDGTTTLVPNPTYDAKNVTLVKSLWNYFLVHGDASGGIHNPTFVFDVLNATDAQLSSL